MKTLLESMDLFAHPISFNYRKKKVFHSFFGMGLSFILYGLIIYFSYFFSIDFIKSSNPKVTYKETEFEEEFNFTITEFFSKFSLYIQLNESLYTDTGMDDFIAKNTQGDFLDGIINLNLISKYGNEEYLKVDYIKVSVDSTYKSIAKFDCQYEYPKLCLYLVYIWDTNDLNIYNVTKHKVRLTENQTYTNSTEILPFDKNKKLNILVNSNVNLLFGIEFKDKFYVEYKNITNSVFTDFLIYDNIINTNDVDFFKKYNKSNLANFAIKNLDKDIEYYEYIYKMVRVKDDKGLILSSFSDKNKFQRDGAYTKKKLLNKIVGIQFASVNFDKVMKHYDRVYRKLQNIFADIGGIFNSFLLIGHLLIFQFNYKKFNYDLINFLFHPDDQENEEKESFGQSRILSSNLSVINNETKNIKYLNNTNSNFQNEMTVVCNTENNVTCRKNIFRKIEPSKDMDEINFDKSKNLDKSDLKINDGCNRISNKFKNHFAQNDLNINSIKSVEMECFDENKLEERIEEYLKSKKHTKKKFIKFSRIEFFKLFVCCKRLKSEALQEKEKIFTKAESKIIEYFDILTYTMFHEEFEKLKYYIFDQYQLNAFQFTKSRKISDILHMDLAKSVLESVKCFKKKMKENLIDEIDRKLLNSFNKEFRSYIE